MAHLRSDIVNTLVRRINSFTEGYRQNIAIIGEQWIGKTSLIKDLLSSNEIKKECIIPIYLEVKIEPFEFCAKRFIKSALFQLINTYPFLSPVDTVLLIEDVKRVYPKTAETCTRVLRDIEKGRFDEAYSFMLDIPAVIFEETKRRCVFILDEFQNLDNFTLKHIFGTLAKKIMIQKDTMYILLSSKSTISQRLINEKLSLLFGNFEKIFMPNFDINTSRLFLQDNIKAATFPPAYLDFVGSFSGNKPFYMRVIAEEVDRLIFSKKIPPDEYANLIEKAFTETIFKKTGIINQYFSNFLFRVSDGKLLSKTTAILIALSSENKKQQDMVKAAKMQARDVSRLLNKLIETDIIARNGSLYRFKDKLFCFWLRSVYLKRIMSFSIDEDLEKRSFEKETRNQLDVFMREFEKELSSRIMELFRLFKNDVIQLNGKRHKFSSFDNVGKIEGSFCDATDILATNDRLKWLCTIKKECVSENDVREMVKKIRKKKSKNRINRSILISLGGINENAYLLAKEAKFWVWDLESLNVLMELYGKPHIG